MTSVGICLEMEARNSRDDSDLSSPSSDHFKDDVELSIENEEGLESGQADQKSNTRFSQIWTQRNKKLSNIPRLPVQQTTDIYNKFTEKKSLAELAYPYETKSEACMAMLEKYLPILTWFPKYFASEALGETFLADLIAGLTVAVMAIPQSMSYADIAGLKYVFGMYAIFITCFVYGCTGGSRQLGVGPVAMVSLIVEAGLNSVMTRSDCPAYWDDNPEGAAQYEKCPEVYQQIVFTCSLCVGVINLVGGFLNLGFLVNFLAHPVVSGFTSGAAIIIGLSQIKYILGYDIPKSQYVYETVANIFKDIGKLEPVVFVLGMLFLFGLAFLSWATKNPEWPRWKPLKPFGPLIFCGLGIFMCGVFPSLTDKHHVKIVGDIPDGFPPLSFSDWDLSRLGDVMSTAISASLIGYMESIAIGKALARKNDYKIDAGCEMVSLGVTNLIGSMFSCYPVTGSFSRSAVNDAVGARTQLAGLITSLAMFLTLMFLTPAFYYLPKFVLGGIVINSVKNLVAYDEAMHLWHVKFSDFVLWMTSFLGTLFLGIQLGIGIAVVLSLLILIHETVTPQMQVLWRLPYTHVYASIKATVGGYFTPGVLVVRFMGSMYFGNCNYLEDKIDQLIESYDESLEDKNRVQYVIISMDGVMSIDSTAVHALMGIEKDLRKRDIQLGFAQVNNRVRRTLEAGDVVTKIGSEWFHATVHDAVSHWLNDNDDHIEDIHMMENLEHVKDIGRRMSQGLDIPMFGVHC